MRRSTDAALVRDLVRELGGLAREPATVYLVGGTTAVLEGWRQTTLDIDLYLEPEIEVILRAIPALKERLDVNIELASPLDFLPALPGWRDRSMFVSQEGRLTVRHFDLYAQALAKLERGFDQDEQDVAAMIERGLVDVAELGRLLEAIEPELYRFPAVDPESLRGAVDELGDGFLVRSQPRVNILDFAGAASASAHGIPTTAEELDQVISTGRAEEALARDLRIREAVRRPRRRRAPR